MKVPPKRKGNQGRLRSPAAHLHPLNESPSEKEGKYMDSLARTVRENTLNESPSEKEGK